jgi:hypothetical protein
MKTFFCRNCLCSLLCVLSVTVAGVLGHRPGVARARPQAEAEAEAVRARPSAARAPPGTPTTATRETTYTENSMLPIPGDAPRLCAL